MSAIRRSESKESVYSTSSNVSGVGNWEAGDRVRVDGRNGTISFIGPTRFAPGEWIGLALDDPEGKNDGSVQGVRYFQCTEKHGLFCKAGKLERLLTTPLSPDREGPISPHAAEFGFDIGNRVIVSGGKVGTLRFLDTTQFAQGIWAGVELDQPVGKNDGSVQGVRYFACKPLYGLFAPAGKTELAPNQSPSKLLAHHTKTSLLRQQRRHGGSRESLSSIGASSLASSRMGLAARRPIPRPSIAASATGHEATIHALQEALKEKDKHLEQMMKERDLERLEMAKVLQKESSPPIQVGAAASTDELKAMKNRLMEKEKMLEDLQFRMEEELTVRDARIEELEAGQSLPPIAADSGALEQKLSELAAANEQSSATLAAVEIALSEARLNIANLEKTVEAERAQKEKGISDAEDVWRGKYGLMQHEMETVASKLSESETLLATRLSEVDRITSELDACQENGKRTEREAEAKIADLEKKLDEEITQSQKGGRDAEEWRAKLSQLEAELHAASSTIESKDALASSIKAELLLREQQLAEAEDGFQKQLAVAQARTSDLERIVNAEEIQRKLLSTAAEESVERFSKLESELQLTAGKLRDVEGELESSRKQFQGKENEYNDAISSLKQELQEQRNQLETTTGDKGLLEATLKERISCLENERDASNEREKVLSQELAALRTALEDSQNGKDTLDRKFIEQKEMFEARQLEMETEKSRLENSMRTVEKEKEKAIECLKAQFEQCEKQTEEQIVVMREETDAEKKRCEALTVEVALLKGQLEDEAGKRLEAETFLRRERDERAAALEAMESARLGGDQLEVDLAEAKKALAEEKAQKQHSEAIVESLKSVESELKLKLTALESQMKAADDDRRENETRSKAMMKNLESTAEAVENARSKLEFELGERTGELAELMKELEGQKSVNERLMKENEEGSSVVQNLRESVEASREEVTQAQIRESALLEEKQKMEERMAKLRENLEQLEKDRNASTSTLSEELQAIRRQAAEDLKERKAEIDGLSNRVETMHSENERLVAENSSFAEVAKRLKTRLDELTSASDSRVEFLSQELSKLRTEHDEQGTKLTESSAAKESLSKQLEDFAVQAEESNRQRAAEKEELTRQLEFLKAELQRLMEENVDGRSVQDKQLAELCADNQRLEVEKTKLSQEVTLNVESLAKLQAEQLEQIRKVESSSAEIVLLREQLKTVSGQLKEKEAELETKVQLQGEESERLRETVEKKADVEKHRKDLEIRLESAEAEVTALRSQLAESSVSDQMASEFGAAMNQVKVLSAEKKDWQSEMETIRIELDTLRRKESELAARENEAKQKIDLMNELDEEWRKKEARFVEKIEDLNMRLETAVKRTTDDVVSQLNQQVEFLNSIIADKNKREMQLKAKIEALENLPITTALDGLDLSLGGFEKAAKPSRMWCDICEVFDVHETEDCPTQASQMEEWAGHSHGAGRSPEGKKQRPPPREYCDTCEEFGHDTSSSDCPQRPKKKDYTF